MEYPDDVLKAAREIAEQVCLEKMMEFHRKGKIALANEYKALAMRIRAANDTPVSVLSSAAAIMAERQRCAEKATVTKVESSSPWERGYEAAADHIKQAILGQQTPAPAPRPAGQRIAVMAGNNRQ